MTRTQKFVSPLILVLSGLFVSPVSLLAGQSFLERFSSDFKKAISREQPRPVQSGRIREDRNTKNEPVPEQKPTGTTKRASNLRSGPGKSHSIVGLVPKGASVTIVTQQGKWYQIKTKIEGSPAAGWMYSPLVEVKSQKSAAALSRSATAPPNENSKIRPDGSTITYAGYSKQFLPVKQMMKAGNLEGIQKHYSEIEEKIGKKKKKENEFIVKVGYLGWLERGILQVDAGEYERSVEDLSFAERILDERMADSKAEEFLMGTLTFASGLVIGNEELGDYSGEGYERVLMLNYKSLAYLLQGKRQAYNVTRRAINWQNMEKKAFEKMRRKIKKKLTKERKGQRKEGKSRAVDDIERQIDKKYASLDAKALSVPSAYVNPFGYYVAGMIQEYESYDDWSLRGNARISYKKALELNPQSDVLKKAVKDLSKRQTPTGTRIVHVIVADGFVPEKKMLTYGIRVKEGEPIPLKLSIYEPDPSTVGRIEVQTTGGNRLATLSPVADIEAICLRHQKDMELVRQLRVALAVASSVVTRSVFSRMGPLGKILSKTREKMASPDMRSWMSLPATINAARLHLRRGINTLKIVTYGKKGKRIASRKVRINKKSHAFVYARSLNKQLFTHSPKELWMLAGK